MDQKQPSLRSKHGNHLACFPLAEDEFTPKQANKFAKRYGQAYPVQYADGVQSALACFVALVLKKRVKDQYTSPERLSMDMDLYLRELAESMAHIALCAMDEHLKTFMDAQGHDGFERAMSEPRKAL